MITKLLSVFKTKFHCATCKTSGVRLYRPYGNFFRPEDNRCNKHITEKQRGWYVPLCPDEDGSIWGYTSIPDEAIDIFYALPEADPKYFTWDQRSPNRDPHENWRFPNQDTQ